MPGVPRGRRSGQTLRPLDLSCCPRQPRDPVGRGCEGCMIWKKHYQLELLLLGIIDPVEEMVGVECVQEDEARGISFLITAGD